MKLENDKELCSYTSLKKFIHRWRGNSERSAMLIEQYLLDNTYLDRASISRHEYMSLYEENGEMFIKLNLQVRFK